MENRWKQHCKPSEHKRRGNYAIYNAMNKYGVENFYCESLEGNIPYDKLDEKEIFYIDKFNSYENGYNSTPGGDGKIIHKIEDLNNIIDRLKHGEMVKDIAADYGVHTYTLNRNLKSIGIENPTSIREEHCVRYDLRILPRERIIELYKQGISHNVIADELNIDQRSVSRVVKEFGLNKRKIIDYNSLPLEEILDEYEKCEKGFVTKKDVMKKYGLNQHSISVIKKLKNIS